MCTVRPETWQKWHGPQAGSTMFLSPNEQVSVENLLKGIVTLSGNDASRRAGRVHCGHRAGLHRPDERAGASGSALTNSHFGTANGWPDNGVTYVTARDLATLARCDDREPPRPLQAVLFAAELHLGQDDGLGQRHHPGQPQPDPRHGAGADGLKTGHTEEAGYGFTGSAEQNGRRLIEVLAGLAELELSGSRNRRG